MSKAQIDGPAQASTQTSLRTSAQMEDHAFSRKGAPAFLPTYTMVIWCASQAPARTEAPARSATVATPGDASGCCGSLTGQDPIQLPPKGAPAGPRHLWAPVSPTPPGAVPLEAADP